MKNVKLFMTLSSSIETLHDSLTKLCFDPERLFITVLLTSHHFRPTSVIHQLSRSTTHNTDHISQETVFSVTKHPFLVE